MSDVEVTTYEGEITATAVGTTITVSNGSIAAGGGGGGAVDSVNGEVGVVVLDATDVGADATGTATAAVAAHVAAIDPHPSYLTSAEGDAAYDALGAAASAQSAAATDATNKVAAHEADTTSVHGIADTSALATTAAVAAGYQPLDSDLTAIAALTTTTFGRALLAMADAAATKTALSLTKSDVGLSNVDNTADASKPVSAAQQTALDLKANLASPALTGTPTAPTAAGGTNTTQLATTAFATAGISALSTVYQPLDSDLTSIAALTTTTYGRAFLALANQAAFFALFTGTPSSTTYLRGDGSWSTPAGGSGSVATDTIFDAKGDLAVGTGSDTAAKLTAGTNGYAVVADSAQSTGLKYAPRGIIGYCQYAPAIGIGKTTASATSADVDATNLVVSFVGPPSGNVIVTLSAYSTINAASSQMRWGLRSGSSDVTGSYMEVMSSPGSAGTPAFITASVVMAVTPGTSYTWKWAFYRASGGATCYIFAGADANGGTGPAVMKVEALP